MIEVLLLGGHKTYSMQRKDVLRHTKDVFPVERRILCKQRTQSLQRKYIFHAAKILIPCARCWMHASALRAAAALSDDRSLGEDVIDDQQTIHP